MYPPFRPKRRWLQYWIYRFRHGFFPCDCWNLDHELALWILPRLKLFKKMTHGYPGVLHDGKDGTEEDWDKILGEMIEGFEFKAREWDIDIFSDKEAMRKMELAFRHLGHYGQHLWD
jgi:hypothetical protein